MTHTTREGWLVEGMTLLGQEFFTSRGHEVPEKLQVACGWPKASQRAIGQCWSPNASADATTQMYVAPTESEPVQVLDVLLHEMIHAVVGCEHGHRGPFKKMAQEIGLAGKMTATYAEPGSDLHALLQDIAAKIGDYPHAAMTKKGPSGKRVYPYVWKRLMSVKDSSYTITISPRVMEEHGRPVDPWGEEMIDWVKGG